MTRRTSGEDFDHVPESSARATSDRSSGTIFRHEFSEIGTLVIGESEDSQEVCPGEVITNMFFWGSHFDYDIARGPFRSSHD